MQVSGPEQNLKRDKSRVRFSVNIQSKTSANDITKAFKVAEPFKSICKMYLSTTLIISFIAIHFISLNVDVM